MYIIVLDDQPGLAGMLASSLHMAGHSARGYTDPAEALAVIGEADVLVTDYHLPGTTGLEIARQAYAQGWRGSVLLMSGYPGRIKESLEHPLLRLVLAKPFANSELADAIAILSE